MQQLKYVTACPVVALSVFYCCFVQAEERHDSTEERLLQLEQNLSEKEVELQRVSRILTLQSL